MPGRSRRTLGRWIRICCTVSHLPGQPPIPWGRWRMGSLEAEDGRDTRAGLDSWTRASLRPAGGQPPPVILDDTATSYGPPTPPSSRAWACSRLHSALRAGRPRPAAPAATDASPRARQIRESRHACVSAIVLAFLRHLAAARPCWPGSSGTVRTRAAVGRHPKVPAGWNVAARRPVTRRCYRAGWVRCQGIRPSWRARVGGFGAVGGAEPAQDVGHMLSGQRQCPQRADLDDAADLALAGRHAEHVMKQQQGSLPRREALQQHSIASDSEPAVSACRAGSSWPSMMTGSASHPPT